MDTISPALQVYVSELCAPYLVYAHRPPRPRCDVLQHRFVHCYILSVHVLHADQVLEVSLGMLHRCPGWHSRGSFQQHLQSALPRPLNSSTALCYHPVRAPYLACDNPQGFCCLVVTDNRISTVSVRDGFMLLTSSVLCRFVIDRVSTTMKMLFFFQPFYQHCYVGHWFGIGGVVTLLYVPHLCNSCCVMLGLPFFCRYRG